MKLEVQLTGVMDVIPVEAGSFTTDDGVLRIWYPGTYYAHPPDITYSQNTWVSVVHIKDSK